MFIPSQHPHGGWEEAASFMMITNAKICPLCEITEVNDSFPMICNTLRY